MWRHEQDFCGWHVNLRLCRARGRGRLPQALKAAHLRVSRQALALAAQVLQPALTQLVAGRSLASSPFTIRWDAWQLIAGILIQLVLEAARQADGAGGACAPARSDSTGGRKNSGICCSYHQMGAWQVITSTFCTVVHLVLDTARQADGAGAGGVSAPAQVVSTGGRKKSRIFSFYHEVGQGWENGWKAQHRALSLQWCVRPYCFPAGECWDALLLLRKGTGQLPHWRYF